MPAGIRMVPGLSPEAHVALMFETLLDLIAATNATNGAPLFTVAAFTSAYNTAVDRADSLMRRNGNRMTYGT
jgi:hypothetical protein